METKGKFILYTLEEFEVYLRALNVDGLRPIKHIQTHHTWSPAYRNFNGRNHFEKLASMEADHKARGFGQIAQHFTTFPDGVIAVCRPLEIKPTCIHLFNTGGICIENLGNFDKGGDIMTPVHASTITAINALLCHKFNLPVNTDTIIYHHWFRQTDGVRDDGQNMPVSANHKTCPGTNFFGGNLVESANRYFLPLIQKDLDIYRFTGKAPLQAERSGIVNADLLNVRSGPSVDTNILFRLKRDEHVKVIETKGDWDRIGENQWVNSDYIAII